MNTKPTRAPTAHIVPFGLRLQPDLKARLEESATANGRSLNAEIAARLEESLGRPSGATVELGTKSLDAIEARVKHALKQK